MFNQIAKEKRLQQLETENRLLRSKLAETVSQTEYIAMMNDIDLPSEVSAQVTMEEATENE